MPHGTYFYKSQLTVYLKFKFNQASCIVSGDAVVLESSGLKGAQVAQSVECLTFDSDSGHDRGFNPCIGLLADSAEPASDSLFFSLSK